MATFLIGKSYTEELLERWIQSPNPETVMKSTLEGVSDTCSSELMTIVSTKNSTHEWEFTLQTEKILYVTALLQDTHRAHFELKTISFKLSASNHKNDSEQMDIVNNQEWILKVNEPQVEVDTESCKEYNIKIGFHTNIFGTFRQSVIFDFGTKPALVKHLCVDVMPVTDIEKINELRKEIVLSSIERWNESNAEITLFTTAVNSLVPSYGYSESNWTKSLTELYPSPRADTFVLSQTTVVERKLTRQNYRARIHELLYIEEMARYDFDFRN